MTYDPTEAARLIAQNIEDDGRMTAGPWRSDVWYGSERGGWAAIGPHHEGEMDCDGPGDAAETKAQTDAAGIARLRNNARPIAEQLQAARGEIDRLERANWMHRQQLDGLQVNLSDAKRERDQLLRAEVNRLSDTDRRLGQLDGLIATSDAAECQRVRAEAELMRPVVEAAERQFERFDDDASDVFAAVDDYHMAKGVTNGRLD